MKTKHLSSEQNGISIAVDVGTEKPVYMTPTQLRNFVERAPALADELASVDEAVLDAIDARAALTPDARKAARLGAQKAKLEAALASAQTDAARAVAEAELKLFILKNS